jgi:acetyltransferase-like isoleucine patch superfamily enzyme
MTPILALIGETLRGLIEWLLSPIPGPAGYALRWLYYKLVLGGLGWGTLIDVGVRFEYPRTVFVGAHSWIDRNVLIIGAVPDPLKGRPGRWTRRDERVEGRVTIGDRTHVGPNCVLSGMAGLRIGGELTLAAGTVAYSLSHHYRSLDEDRPATFSPRAPRKDQFMIAGPIEIGDRSGTGIGSVILPGARLAPGAFLSIGGVLRGDTEPGWVYAGNPARPVKPRSGQ